MFIIVSWEFELKREFERGCFSVSAVAIVVTGRTVGDEKASGVFPWGNPSSVRSGVVLSMVNLQIGCRAAASASTGIAPQYQLSQTLPAVVKQAFSIQGLFRGQIKCGIHCC